MKADLCVGAQVRARAHVLSCLITRNLSSKTLIETKKCKITKGMYVDPAKGPR